MCIIPQQAAEDCSTEEVYTVFCTLLRTVLQRATKITTAALECTGHLEFIQVPLWRSLNTALRWTALHIYDQIATPLF